MPINATFYSLERQDSNAFSQYGHRNFIWKPLYIQKSAFNKTVNLKGFSIDNKSQYKDEEKQFNVRFGPTWAITRK